MQRTSVHRFEHRRDRIEAEEPSRPLCEVARGGPLSERGLSDLQQTAGNTAVSRLVAQRSGEIVVQRDDYPYGGPNVTPHIHRYGGDSHLKILDGASIKRLNLVQGGKRYPDNVARAFDLARAASNDALVDAIKACIHGVGPFGRPGSEQV